MMNHYLRRHWSTSFKQKIYYSTPMLPLYYPVNGLECEPNGYTAGTGHALIIYYLIGYVKQSTHILLVGRIPYVNSILVARLVTNLILCQNDTERVCGRVT